MRPYISLLAVFSALFVCLPAHAQFDFGGILKNEGRQILRQVENRIVEEIKNEVLPIHRVQPPIKTLPYHPVENERIIHETPVEVQPSVEKPASSAKISSRKKPAKLPQVESGNIVTLEGKGFGEEPGAVFVKIESLVLYTELVDWNDNLAEAILPELPMANSVKATVFVMKANEEIAEQLEVELTPPSEPEEEPAAEAEAELPQVFSEQEVTLEGNLGDKPGKVALAIGKLKLQAKVLNWSATETSFQLPKLSLEGTHEAVLTVINADGKLAEEMSVLFSAAEQE